MMSRASCEAVMSRNTSSSAPWASYASAASTGSPASRRLTNPTPLTTRPSLTSRQGMMRLASMSPPHPNPLPPGERGKLCNGGHRRPQIKHAFVEGLADDRANHLRPQRAQLTEVLGPRDAAGGDQRRRTGRRHAPQALKIGALQHSIPRDISIDHGVDGQSRQAADKVGGVLIGDLGPSLHGNLAPLGIHPDEHAARKAAAGLLEYFPIADDGRPEDDPLHPGGEIG